jgi:release factor glutamine methyltransferase
MTATSQEIAWLLAEKYHGEKTADFFTDCERLTAGEPLAYIIGSIPFLNCSITLDSRPLIPRPETEYWVEKAISTIKANGLSPVAVDTRSSTPPQPPSRQPHVHVLDLCAGSGAIGVAVAKALPEVHVAFGEIMSAHLSTIEKNCRRNGITPERVQLFTSDLFTSIPGQYNFILTNPPYIDAKAHTIDATVAQYEPHEALFGGVSGLSVITDIITTASAKLCAHGQLWIEHEPFQTKPIHALGSTCGFQVMTHRDQYHTARYSVLTPIVTQ